MSQVTLAIVKNTRQLRLENKGSTVVTTKGNIMDLTAGLAVDATASSTRDTLVGVCNQTTTAAEALTQVLIIVPGEDDTYEVDSTQDSLATDNGQAMIIGANAHTINNTHTTSAVGVVVQVGVKGATTDRKILVRFIK